MSRNALANTASVWDNIGTAEDALEKVWLSLNGTNAKINGESAHTMWNSKKPLAHLLFYPEQLYQPDCFRKWVIGTAYCKLIDQFIKSAYVAVQKTESECCGI